MSKKIKNIISILLIVVLLLSSFSAYAFNAKQTVNDSVALLQEGCFDIPPKQQMYLESADTDLQLQEYLYAELLKVSPNIKIDNNKYKYSSTAFKELYCNVINDHPDLFYVSSSYSTSIYSISKNVASVTPSYTLSQNEIADAKIVFNNGVDKALSLIDNSMDDMQKALVLHDYICDKAVYERPGEIAHSAYGFFKDGKIVCSGYSLTYSYLLNKVGVQCEFESSSPMQHAWNLVKINNNWYHADLTYDDIGCYNQNENIRGAMMHNFFLKSDDFFISPNGGCHYGFNTYEGGIASDTSLDNYFWNDVDTYIPVVDGDYYYLDVEPSKYVYLKRRDKQGNETYVNKNLSFNTPAFNLTSSYTDEAGVSHQVSFKDVLIRLAYLDDRFYIAYNNSLKSVFKDGKSYDICDLTNYPVGMGAENGNIVYQPYQTYSPILLNKQEFLDNYLMIDNSSNYNNYADVFYDGVINTKDYALNQNTNYVF